MKRAVLRPRAEADLLQEHGYLAEHRGDQLALEFFELAIAAVRAIEQTPGGGSPRIGRLADVKGLRSWRIGSYQRAWFYFERSDFVDVVRLLGDAQDVISLVSNEH
jgi:toxin ParE1/3/4